MRFSTKKYEANDNTNNDEEKKSPQVALTLEKRNHYYYFMFQNAKYLKELYLSRNQFGSAAGEILGPAISELPRTFG